VLLPIPVCCFPCRCRLQPLRVLGSELCTTQLRNSSTCGSALSMLMVRARPAWQRFCGVNPGTQTQNKQAQLYRIFRLLQLWRVIRRSHRTRVVLLARARSTRLRRGSARRNRHRAGDVVAPTHPTRFERIWARVGGVAHDRLPYAAVARFDVNVQQPCRNRVANMQQTWRNRAAIKYPFLGAQSVALLIMLSNGQYSMSAALNRHGTTHQTGPSEASSFGSRGS